MKAVVCAVILCLLVVSSALAADAPKKVTLDVKSMAIKDVVTEISKQAGVAVVLDPKAQGSLTATLSDADLSQVLDVLTKSNNLTWKKLQFAKPQDSKVSLDQLKSGILALASMPLVGLAVEDPTGKSSAVVAKDIPGAPDTSKLSLPDGYSWTTVYVVLAPEPAPADKDKVAALSKAEADRIAQLANMTPEERKQFYTNQWMAQLGLAPEARQALMRDQMQALFGLDPQYRNQFMQDMRATFQGMRGQNGGPGGWRGRLRNNGN